MVRSLLGCVGDCGGDCGGGDCGGGDCGDDCGGGGDDCGGEGGGGVRLNTLHTYTNRINILSPIKK